MGLFSKATLTVAFVVKGVAPSEQSMIGLDTVAKHVVIASIGADVDAKRRAHEFGAHYIELAPGTSISGAKNRVLCGAATTWVLYLGPFDVLDETAQHSLLEVMEKKGDGFILYQKRYTKKEKNALLPGFIANTGSSMERGSGYLLSGSLCLVRVKDGVMHDALGDITQSIVAAGGVVGEANIFIHSYEEFEGSATNALTIEDRTRAVGERPSARGYFDLACAHVHKKNYDAALQAFAKANELDPNNVDVLNNMGITLVMQGRRVKATKVLLRALRIHPGSATSFNNPYPFSSLFATIGTVFKDMAEYKKAIIAYEKAIRIGHPDKDMLQAHVDGMKRHLEQKVKPSYQFGVMVDKNAEDL